MQDCSISSTQFPGHSPGPHPAPFEQHLSFKAGTAWWPYHILTSSVNVQTREEELHISGLFRKVSEYFWCNFLLSSHPSLPAEVAGNLSKSSVWIDLEAISASVFSSGQLPCHWLPQDRFTHHSHSPAKAVGEGTMKWKENYVFVVDIFTSLHILPQEKLRDLDWFQCYF